MTPNEVEAMLAWLADTYGGNWSTNLAAVDLTSTDSSCQPDASPK